MLRQGAFEELSRSGREVRAPGARASRPLTIPQFIADTALAPVEIPRISRGENRGENRGWRPAAD